MFTHAGDKTELTEESIDFVGLQKNAKLLTGEVAKNPESSKPKSSYVVWY